MILYQSLLLSIVLNDIYTQIDLWCRIYVHTIPSLKITKDIETLQLYPQYTKPPITVHPYP